MLRLAVLLLFLAADAFACPLVKRTMIDFNCNGKLKIAITGDSIVSGVGDEVYTEKKSGYVLRLGQLLRAKVTNLGIAGITSGGLLRAFMRNIDKERTSRLLRDADIIIIDVGRNDYWLEDSSPEEVARNIERTIAFLRKKLKTRDLGVRPFFMVSTLIPTERSFQQPFVDQVNSALRRFNSRELPLHIFFDTNFSTSILSEDGLHPNAEGYDTIAIFLKRFLKNDAQIEIAKKRRDRDGDGAYNYFEKYWYHTDPRKKDTDGDGFWDGAEIYQLGTDPLDAG